LTCNQEKGFLESRQQLQSNEGFGQTPYWILVTARETDIERAEEFLSRGSLSSGRVDNTYMPNETP